MAAPVASSTTSAICRKWDRAGEDQPRRRLAGSGYLSEREEAALAWAECLTLLAETHVPDADFEAAQAVFSEQELASLTAAVAAINVWNRFSVAYRFAPEID